MKRKKQDKHKYYFKKFRSYLFWSECTACKMEFRRENGWYFRTQIRSTIDDILTTTTELYLCNGCGQNDIIARDIFLVAWQRMLDKIKFDEGY